MIWVAKDRTTGKDYVVDPNVVMSVINESTSKTPLGIFNINDEDKDQGTTKPLEQEDLGLT